MNDDIGDDQKGQETPNASEPEKGRRNAGSSISDDKSTPAAPAATNVIKIDDTLKPVTYDYKKIEKFLDVVFHAEFSADEHVCTYFDAKGQGFPMSEEALLTKLPRVDRAAKLYFGTATVSMDKDHRKLLNRKANFFRYHVLVLDDIGTKVPLDKIPEGLEPTYIIESSPDNFQYGFVFDEPLTDYEQARALVELVYSSGVTDEGGKLVNKKVRLPDGINGKKESPHREFRVKLHTMDGPYWTPQALLKTLGLSTRWDDVIEDAERARALNSKIVGTSLWSPTRAQHVSLDGIIDPIMEWLDDNGLLLSFDGEWATIVCPWALTHSDGRTEAYYSPLGYGEGDFKSQRGYNCYHSHSEVDKTQALLDYVVANGGPECAQFDPAGALVASHVYDSYNNTMWGIKSLFPRAYANQDAFKTVYNQQTRRTVLNKEGKPELKSLTMAQLFLNNPARVVVEGTTFDPTSTARLLKDDDGALRMNTFSPPDWGEGSYDMAIVQKFIDFLTYLIPNAEERAYFIAWLACKVQNMGFRGWGMMMVAKSHGTGRGTLANILTALFDPRNCADVPFSELINPKDNFNEWQSKLLVVSNEAADHSDTTTFYKQYTQLKELIDTTPKHITVNNKYGKKESRILCTSHLIFTNYENGAALEEGDRRIYVIGNAETPATPEYFTKLNEWMRKTNGRTTTPLFVNHVARWLKSIPVDLATMNGPAPSTQAKEAMFAASQSALDTFATAFFDALPSPFSTAAMFKECAYKYDARLNHPSDALIRRIYLEYTNASHPKNEMSLKGKTVRLRVTHRFEGQDFEPLVLALRTRKIPTTAAGNRIKRQIRSVVEDTKLNEVAQAVDDALTLAGY